ncbi:MAG: hypothetical protein EU536_04895, partial [Promethearchaeota archaeon]
MASLLALRMRVFLAITVLFSVLFMFLYFIFWLLGLDLIIYPILLAVVLVIVQWALSSRLISAVSKIRWLRGREDNPLLWDMVQSNAKTAGVQISKVGVSEIPQPNAFVYGIFNTNLVVTVGLLRALEDDRAALEGVIWHEIGHVKHGDMKLMMVLATLPIIFYMIAISLLWGRSRRNEGGLLIGGLAFGMYFLMSLGILLVSRYREYLADGYSNKMNGAIGIIRGLSKLAYLNKKSNGRSSYAPTEISLKSLFIVEPETGNLNYLIMAANIIADDEGTRQRILAVMQQ